MKIVIAISLIIILCIIYFYIGNLICKETERYHRMKECKYQLENDVNTLKKEIFENQKSAKELDTKIILLQKDYEQHKKKADDIREIIKNQEQLSQDALSNFYDVLDKDYEKKSKEYDESIELLHKSYKDKQLEIQNQIDQEKKNLDDLKKSYASIVAARLKEKEIKEQLSFYCLQVSELDLADIKMLEKIKPNLNKPRVLSMLIWSTFFQKQMNTLCANVLGSETVTGIYKITNQLTNEVYIGQAVDVATRWKQHAKCGLGIDTPANNKLYKAMIEDGIWNFSWELLEKCQSSELNKKEREYIELYQSKDYGYNTLAGNQR